MRNNRPSARVRRRLFSEDETDEARKDNTANILLELIESDQKRSAEKYNFDFVNCKPLEGDYEWTKTDCCYDWVGKEKGIEKIEGTEIPDKKFLDIREENEATPIVKQEETLCVRAATRKRKSDSEIDAEAVRRKIDFE